MTLSLRPADDETIAGASQALREGRITSLSLVERCLAKIEKWESKVKAWAIVDCPGAIAQARDLDRELRSGNDRGPLHGIPIGIKDIIDVAQIPTGLGTTWTSLHVTPPADADVVARLREAGAVILGKTVTTPFAWIDPPPTCNPWDLKRTPGGSSSGSAAAVATGMCLGAIGSQTGGSITRPASFCGVAGLKPTFGSISTTGVFPFAPNLDTVGPLARTSRDLDLIYRAIGRDQHGNPLAQEMTAWVDPPRIGRLRGLFHREADDAMRRSLDRATHAWKEAGSVIGVFDPPEIVDEVRKHHRTMMAVEAAASHLTAFASARHEYPPELTKLLDEGLSLLGIDYLVSHGEMEAARQAFYDLFENEGLDLLITPAARGPAPDRSTTGDPIFNALWTYLGFPTVTFPIGRSPEGLPLGVQLIGRAWKEDELLAFAEGLERHVHPLLFD